MNPQILLILIGIGAGILSGMIGVGGGIVIVPALVYFLGYSQLKAQGTSLMVIMLPVGILAVMNYFKSGNAEWKSALWIASGFVLGAFLGSTAVIKYIPEDLIRKIFAVILIYTAIKLLLK
jgi:uncharacterized membrane protein YfcA